MTDREERIILNWLNDNFNHSNCFRPDEIYAHVHHKITPEDTVVTTCRRLHAKNLIEEITNTPNDSMKRNSCYRISQLGIDELNPNTRDKQMFRFAKIGAAAGIIAAITSIIAVIAILFG